MATTKPKPSLRPAAMMKALQEVNTRFLPPHSQTKAAPSEAQRLVGEDDAKDMVLASLRSVIYQMEPRSWPAIATLMRQDMADSEIYALISKHKAECTKFWQLWQVEDNDRFLQVDYLNKWKKVDTVIESEQGKKKAKKSTLRKVIDEYREKYAKKLRDLDLQDVDVLYVGEWAHTGAYKVDQAKILKGGATFYYRFPTDERNSILGMSIIIPCKTLEEVYPGDREGITIRVNTTPAAADPEVTDQLDQPNITADEKVDKVIDQLVIKRTRSLEALLKAPKTPGRSWYPYPSSTAKDLGPPAWPEPLFSRTYGYGDNAWWKFDEQDLRDQLKQQPGVARLSNTYVGQPDWDWHKKNLDGDWETYPENIHGMFF